MLTHLVVIVLSAVSLSCLTLLAADSEDFMTAIQKGEIAKVTATLDRQPRLANAQERTGVLPFCSRSTRC